MRLVGTTTTAPLIPFRIQPQGRRKTDPPGPQAPSGASRLFLNGIDYTHACSQIEGRQEAIDITCLEDAGRRYLPGQTYLPIPLLVATDFQIGDRIAIRVLFPDGYRIASTGILTNHLFGCLHDRIENVLTFGIEPQPEFTSPTGLWTGIP
jgi:hypothetical protein